MNVSKTCTALGLALSLSCSAAIAADAAVKSKARETLEKNKDAIVTVKMVISTRYVFGGRESGKNERKAEITGTVVDPSGLTVVSNTAVNPMGDMDFSFAGDGENMSVKPETNITDILIVTGDGHEIPAEISMKDSDLDLAFIRPKDKQDKPLPCVAFAKGAEPEVLDEIIIISRLGRALNRSNAVSVGAITSVVKKPRTFYVADVATGYTSLGCPVFNIKGETLGISVMRKSPVKDPQDYFGGQAGVVLPAEDLMEVAKQALIAKIEKTEEKKEEKKEEAKDK